MNDMLLISILDWHLNSEELSRGGSIIFVSVVTPPPLQCFIGEYILDHGNHF